MSLPLPQPSAEKKDDDIVVVDTSDEGSRDNVDQGITFPDGGWVAYRVLFGAFLGLTGAFGLVNTAGLVENQISHKMLPGVSTATIGWIFSLFSFMVFGSSLVVGPIFDSYGYLITYPTGLGLFVLGIMSFSSSTQYYQFLLSYFITGLALSFVFVSCNGCVSHFFSKRRASAMGIAYSGGAVGGIVYPLVLRSLFPKIGFAWLMRVVGFIIIGLWLCSIALVQDRHKEIKPPRDESILPLRAIFRETLGKISYKPFKDPVYTTVVLAITAINFPFSITLTYLVSYGVANGYSLLQASVLIIAMNAVSVIGRLSGGFVADRYGRFNTLCMVSLCLTFFFFVLWLPPPIGHKLGGLFAFSICYGISSGSILSNSPAIIGQISHTKDFALRYGTLSFVASVAGLFGIPIGGALIGTTTNVAGYDHLVILILCVSFVGCVLALASRYLYAGWELRVV